MTSEDQAALLDIAEKTYANYEPVEKARVIKRYMEIMMELNDQIEGQLEQFEGCLLDIFGASSMDSAQVGVISHNLRNILRDLNNVILTHAKTPTIWAARVALIQSLQMLVEYDKLAIVQTADLLPNAAKGN